MSKTLWHVTMSLDGFITGPRGDMSWLADHVGANPTAEDVIGEIGAVLIGNRTFRGDDAQPGAVSPESKPYGGAWDGPQFVLTHRVPAEPEAGFTFVTDLAGGVAAAKRAANGKYVAVLGARTAQHCLDAGLLDEVLVHLAPVLLGDGVRLFERPGGTKVNLERIALTSSERVTNLWFRVPR